MEQCSFALCCDFDPKQCMQRAAESCPDGKQRDPAYATQISIVDDIKDCCIDIVPTPEPTPTPDPTPAPPTPAPPAVAVNCNTADPAPFKDQIAAASGSE